MGLISKNGLWARITRGKAAREKLVASHLAEGIAFQIRATRDAQEMTQEELARATGMSQNNISRLESPDYGRHNIKSLKRIADALGVVLIVRFITFGEFADWLTGTPRMNYGLNAATLAVPSFEKEKKENLLKSRQSYAQITSLTVVGVTVSIQGGTAISTWRPFMYEQNQPAQVVSGSPERIKVGESFDRAIIPTNVNQPTPEEIYARA